LLFAFSKSLMAPVFCCVGRVAFLRCSQRSFAMEQRHQHAPKNVYVLADHLDAILAATEDLLKLDTRSADPSEVLRLELVAITHALQARQRIGELHFAEPRFADQAVVFLAGSAAFEIK